MQKTHIQSLQIAVPSPSSVDPPPYVGIKEGGVPGYSEGPAMVEIIRC
jgi:hypothetical protein